ncbi:hypothetical protein ANACOL_02766 [Anaerotruncus colihominis DSM 17241]|uniref:Uncharacterized protein n=1 Tax=Anaerotruncus colihominis DSM 17241 TaxID=445972 RepID=B0PDY2_9FIRM|nr:hypothetical protein ANACOL_02766 [Anaerotruncus colihominis DSM 17241]
MLFAWSVKDNIIHHLYYTIHFKICNVSKEFVFFILEIHITFVKL